MVIVGAGFGGLTAARALAGLPVEVLLVDANNYHLFSPLLYQVASSLLDPSQIAHPVRELIRGQRNCDFMLARVEGADLERRVVRTDRGEVEYDYLVLACGSVSNFFGNRSLEQHSTGLKHLPDALAIRNWVLGCFERARWETDPDRRDALLTFAVVGGGPTGVEYTGALEELIHLVLRKDYPHLDLSRVRVVLIEGTDHLLGPFDPKLRAAAARSLGGKQVEIWFKGLVKEVTADGVTLEDGRHLRSATVVWTAGVRANDLGAGLGLDVSKSGRVKVGPTLQVPHHPEIFCIGDLASLEQDGAELPMLIPVAMQQAKHVGRAIGDLVAGRPVADFVYHDPGIMATIGRNSGVAQLGPVKLSGFPGWVMWLGVHLINVVTFRSKVQVLLDWMWDYLLYDRPVRLIVRSAVPRVPEDARKS